MSSHSPEARHSQGDKRFDIWLEGRNERVERPESSTGSFLHKALYPGLNRSDAHAQSP